MRFMHYALVLPALLVVSGCSYFFGDEGQFREKTMDYKQAESISPLQLPEGFDSKERSQRYPIPAVGQSNFYVPRDSDDLPKPQGLVSVNEDAGLELRSSEDRRWLVVDQPLERLWPRLHDYLTSNNFTIDRDDKAAGVLETRWLRPRLREEEVGFWASIGNFLFGDDDDLRERFRLTMTPGTSETGSIVTINHVQTRKGEDSLPKLGEIDWPDEPENPELVEIVYNDLMDYLGDGGRQVGVSVLSQDLKALPKFVMTWDGNGYPVLVVNQDFNHAWQDVGAALVRAKIEVEDLDRSLGIYYLKKLPDAEDDKPLQLRLARSESGIQVSVQYDDDALAPKESSAGVLNRLREVLE